MPYISEYSKYLEKGKFIVQKRLCADSNSKKSDPLFPSGRPSLASDAHAQSCVRTPISVKKLLNSARLHPSGRHGNTSGCSSDFVKILAFLCRHGVGRQLALVWMTRQHCPNAEILDKEIACIHSTFVRTPEQHHPDAVLDMEITCRQVATDWTLGQHCLDAALIWKCVKRVMERQLHCWDSGRSMLPSRRHLEKLETHSI